MIFFTKYKLFLDCAFRSLNIVILEFKTNKIIDELSIPVNQNLTELAVYYLENLLKKHKIRRSQIRSFYVTTGPGSFTGQRVGAIIAKTWCTVFKKCKLFALSSLRFQVPYEQGISKISAGGDKNYCGIYSDTIEQTSLLSKADFIQLCKSNSELPLYENFENVDSFGELLLSNIKHFKEIENPKNLTLTYLKDPVN